MVIDPFRSRTARVADEHIRPKPGTDATLALGLMRAMLDAGVHDDEWCRQHTTGYDELLGRLEEWPVDRASHTTGVPADAIVRLGRDIATVQPSLVRAGMGAQRHLGAPAAYRAVACVPALAGSWRHVGGGFSYIPIATIRLLAGRLGLDDPCFRESDDELPDSVLACLPENIDIADLRATGWAKIDLGQGDTPHADGHFGTPDGKLAFRSDALDDLGLDPLPDYDPPSEITDPERGTRARPVAAGIAVDHRS